MMIPIRLTLLALALAGTALAAEPAKPPAVTVAPAVEREIVETLRVTGSLVARNEVVVLVDIEGFRLTELLADAGDRVAAGQVLARLDARTVDIDLAQSDSQLVRADAAIAQARAAIAEAESAQVEAELQLNRSQALKNRGVATQDVLDQRVAAASAARARLNSAKQGLELAEADRKLIEAQRREIALRGSKMEIKAPSGGLVLSRSAKVGMVASTQGAPLFTIARDGMVEMEAEVTETHLAQIAPGMAVAVTPAGAGAPIQGTVRLVSPQVDPTTRLGSLRVALPDDPRLRVGAFARGSVEIARKTGVVVPLSALVNDQDGIRVQVVVDGKVQSRKIETGLRTATDVEVRSGIAVGDQIILRAGSFVQDGDPVTPIPQAEARS